MPNSRQRRDALRFIFKKTGGDTRLQIFVKDVATELKLPETGDMFETTAVLNRG
jgi:hypothetical protein